MSLDAGTRLGPYEIIAAIGRGGMGEVFRARDTRLNRDVALKVLPDSVSSDAERLARFEREAQVLASLNHPNIAHVYGILEGDGSTAASRSTSAIVMELVDGPDLAARIAERPLPVDEAIAIAIQVAHALEAAHEQGIVHRDLKPGNIKVRADGTVKVLDFGLAKALLGAGRAGRAGQAGGEEILNSPTMTSPAVTNAGIILGTAAYMSPEQARGKAVDRRTDIWAFGVVLYEMLTGRTMFAADTVSDTIAAVLTREPSLDAIPPQTPAAVRRMLQRCLQKDPARRLHHIADARLELEQAGSEPALATRKPERAASMRWWHLLALAAATALIVAAALWALFSRPAPPAQRYSFVVNDAGFNTVSASAISPDGKWIAYSPNRNSGPFRLLLRPIDGFDAREIAAGPNTGYNPFFSADGQWLAYVIGGALYRVPVTGGAPERLATVLTGTTDGSWGRDGTILLAANFRADNIVRRRITRLTNGAFEAVTNPGADEAHLDVQLLADNRTALFTIDTPNSASIATVTLGGDATPRVLLTDARRPRYAAGRLFFQRASSGDLLHVAFDPDKVSPSGEPTRIANLAFVADSPSFDVASDGAIIYSAPSDTTAQAGFTVLAVNRSGGEVTVVAQMSSWAEPRVSPDGRTVMLRDITSPNCILWSVDLQRGTRTRVNFDGDNHNPLWHPDGQLTWASSVDGVRSVVMGRVDRPAVSVTRLAPGENERVPDSWSPDGTMLAFTEIHPVKGQDIWLLDSRTGATRPLLNSPYKENQARFSRDGGWLAYVSDESGRDEVYLQPTDGNGARIQVSIDGGSSPLWSPDGRELFFVDKASLMQVTVDLRTSPPDISRPRTLLEGRYVWDRNSNYDITPDGQRFVFIRRTDEADPPATLRVLLNWVPQP
jgi:eukaryotic-like serine/threonine-protein kinase